MTLREALEMIFSEFLLVLLFSEFRERGGKGGYRQFRNWFLHALELVEDDYETHEA